MYKYQQSYLWVLVYEKRFQRTGNSIYNYIEKRLVLKKMLIYKNILKK